MVKARGFTGCDALFILVIYNAENHFGVACPRCSDGQTPEKMAAREISAGDAASMPSVPELRFPGKTKRKRRKEKDGQSN
jgi:hypothetical protein